MRRISELDSIRGLTAVVVMVCHLRPREFTIGGVRTDLFFILSSFLVTSMVLDRGRTPGFLGTFFLRRALRIWPIYYLTLGLLILINPCLPKPFPMDGLPYYLTFTQNVTRYWSDTTPAFNWYFLHTWSLALEVQFYLVWPALVVLAGRRRLVPLGLTLVAVAFLSRCFGLHWWLLIARCDGFGLGAILACIFIDREEVGRRRRLNRAFGLATVGSLALAVAVIAGTRRVELDTTMSAGPSLMVLACNVCYFCIIGLVILNAGHPALGFLRHRALVYLGKVSYGIYLYHALVLIVLTMVGRRLGLGDPLWLDGVKLVVSVAVASLSWQFVEQPILGRRNGGRGALARDLQIRRSVGRLAQPGAARWTSSTSS